MNANPPNITPEDRLSAMLYVLEDPALDRVAWEMRLQHDASLCELVAEMVCLKDHIRSVAPSLTVRQETCVAADSLESTRARPLFVFNAFRVCRDWLPAAAALLLVGFFLWAVVFKNGKSLLDGDFESRSIAAAWTDLQSANLPSVSHGTDDSEVEFSLADASIRHDEDNDVPDWLIFASSVASASTGQGVIQ